MSVTVVNLFKIIHVNNKKGTFVILSPLSVQLLIDHGFRCLPVIQSGQRISLRALAQSQFSLFAFVDIPDITKSIPFSCIRFT